MSGGTIESKQSKLLLPSSLKKQVSLFNYMGKPSRQDDQENGCPSNNDDDTSPLRLKDVKRRRLTTSFVETPERKKDVQSSLMDISPSERTTQSLEIFKSEEIMRSNEPKDENLASSDTVSKISGRKSVASARGQKRKTVSETDTDIVAGGTKGGVAGRGTETIFSDDWDAWSLDENKESDVESETEDNGDDSIVPLDCLNELNDMTMRKSTDNVSTAPESPPSSNLQTPKEIAQQAEAAENMQKRREFFLRKTPISQTSSFWSHYVNCYYDFCETFNFPPWMNPDKIKDYENRPPTHVDFDIQRVRFVKSEYPPKSRNDALKLHFTPAMEQYWEIKKDNFDSIVFFKLGKFYEIFYTDACIVQPICDLKWMGSDSKAHVGFPEPSLHGYAQKLVDRGFKVTVVEQMETPEQLKERNRQSSSKDKAVLREICEIFSSGTVCHPGMLGPETQYLCSICFDGQLDISDGSFGFILVDVSTFSCLYGWMKDDKTTRHALRTFLSQTCPREVLIDRKFGVSEKILWALESVSDPPTISTSGKCPSAFVCGEHFKDGVSLATFGLDSPFPETATLSPSLLEEMSKITQMSTKVAFVTLKSYLHKMLLWDQFVSFGTFQPFPNLFHDEPNIPSMNMRINFVALRSLNILETATSDKSFTLLNSICQTCTNQGRRLLRKWLCSPSCNAKRIRLRQESVEWLMSNNLVLEKLRHDLIKLKDVERQTARLCSQSQSSKAVFFSNVGQKKIHSLLDLLDNLEVMCGIADLGEAELSSQNVNDWNRLLTSEGLPERLRSLLGKRKAPMEQSDDEIKWTRDSLIWPSTQQMENEEDGGFFPDLSGIISKFRSMFYPVDNKNATYYPVQGLDESFDKCLAEVNQAEIDLDNYLQNEFIRSCGLSNSQKIVFVHSKFRYEIEMPEETWKKLSSKSYRSNYEDLPEMSQTSMRSGYVRVHTSELLEVLIPRLEDRESALGSALDATITKVFQSLNRAVPIISLACRLIAEIDVLASFAQYALITSARFPICKPEIILVDESPLKIPFLYIENSFHPIIGPRLANFVPNTIQIATNEDNCRGSLILLTGSNMAGKSTIARQAALLVILAQIGCFVPATKMKFSLVDQIFVRVGAHDSILIGKSTFMIELEEVLCMLTDATKDSLLIIDEFGRGTSTDEGTALALATVEHILENIQCRALFCTHFHLLPKELHDHPMVECFTMGSSLDEEGQKLKFSYNLVRGVAPKSHGIMIARLAGVPMSIIERALVNSSKIEAEEASAYYCMKLRPIIAEMEMRIKSGTLNDEFIAMHRDTVKNCIAHLQMGQLSLT